MRDNGSKNNSPREKPIKLQEAYYSLFERKELKNKTPSQVADFHMERLLGNKKDDPYAKERLWEYLESSGNKELRTLLNPPPPYASENDFAYLPTSAPFPTPEKFTQDALTAFLQHNNEKGYIDAPQDRKECEESPAFKNYLAIAKTVDFFARVIENHPDMQDLTFENAYKIQVLFPPKNVKSPPLQAFDQVFQNAYNAPQNAHIKDSTQPIHDLFLAPLPEGIGHLKMWQDMIAATPDAAPAIIQNTGLFPAIEKLWEKDAARPKSINVKALEHYKTKLTYQHYEKAPELAALMNRMGIKDENIFNRVLALTESGALHFKEGSTYYFADKKNDQMPDVTVSWNDKDLPDEAQKAKGYYWTKLPAGDPRGLFLGHVTGCCQLITGDSEECVVDGMNRDNNGFYLLLKVKNPEGFDTKSFNDPQWWKEMESHADIKAQSYVWKSKTGNFVMDSLEGYAPNGKDGMDDDAIKGFLQQFGRKLEAHGSERLAIGMGGATPPIFGTRFPLPEVMKEGYQYGDSSDQIELTWSKALVSGRIDLEEYIPNANSEYSPGAHILRARQAELLLEAKDILANESQKVFNAFVTEALRDHTPETFAALVQTTCALKESEPAKFKALTSENVAMSDFSIADFIDAEPKKIKVLTSLNAQEFCRNGSIAFADLKKMPAEKLEALVHSDTVTALKNNNGYFSLADLKDLEPQTIEALTQPNEMRNRIEDYIAFDELKIMEPKKIRALTSPAALIACMMGPTSFDELKVLSPDTLEALTYRGAVAACNKGYTTIAALKELKPEKITALTHLCLLDACDKGYVAFAQLKELEPDYLTVLTKTYAAKTKKHDAYLPFAPLDNFAKDKVDALTTYDTKLAHSKGFVAFADLKTMEPKKIRALTEQNAIATYELGIAAKDLMGFEAEDIVKLTSPEARDQYENRKLTPADLYKKNKQEQPQLMQEVPPAPLEKKHETWVDRLKARKARVDEVRHGPKEDNTFENRRAAFKEIWAEQIAQKRDPSNQDRAK